MLEIQNISKKFLSGTPNEVFALKNISLSLDKANFLIVIGTNGSGKSTLLNAIAGSFLTDSGTIHLDDKDMTRMPEYKRASFIGRVFQNPFSGTAPNMSIADNLAMAASRGVHFRGMGWALKKELLNEFKDKLALLGFGLEDRLNHTVGTLSGGQRQALTLLMATWVRPKLLLLDEHTAALDPKSADLVIRLTEKIITQEKLTTLMVTHSMHQAVNLGDRLIMMNKGHIIHDYQGAEKKRLRIDDLFTSFEELRRMEQLDESAANMLKKTYV